MTETPYALEDLARWAADLRFEVIPSNVAEQAKLCVLDLLGVIAAAQGEPDLDRMVEAQIELGAVGNSTVFFRGMTLSVLAAAQVNAYAASTPELSDNVAVHANEATIPLAFAIAEDRGLSAQDLLAAVVAGDEVAKRVHDSYFEWKIEPPRFPIGKPTVLGTVAAAVTAAKLLGLDGRGVFEAINNGLNLMAVALDASVLSGSTLKPLLFSGTAVQAGYQAAVLAKHGIVGAPDSFENPFAGWLHFTATEWDLEALTRDLGTRWVLEKPDRKRHASCGFSHAPLDGVMDLYRQSGAESPEEIERIEIRQFPFAYEATKGSPEGPTTPTAAKFDLPYLIATELTTGEVISVPDTSMPVVGPRLQDETIRALMGKVHTAPDDGITVKNLFSADVTVIMRDGGKHHVWVEDAKGKGANQLTRAEVIAKFRSLATPVLGPKRAGALNMEIGDMHNLKDMAKVNSLLAALPEA